MMAKDYGAGRHEENGADLGQVPIEAGRELARQPAFEKLSVLGLLGGDPEQDLVTMHFDVMVDAQPCKVGDTQPPSGEDRDEKTVSICTEVPDFAVAHRAGHELTVQLHQPFAGDELRTLVARHGPRCSAL